MEHCLNTAFDKQGNIYVTDMVLNRIQVFSEDGNFIRCIGPELSVEHSFAECRGIAIYDQYVVVSDWYNDKVHVLSTAGKHICCVGGLNHPSGIVHDHDGIFYVCDTYNHTIAELQLRLEPMLLRAVDTDPRKSDVRRKANPQVDTDTS